MDRKTYMDQLLTSIDRYSKLGRVLPPGSLRHAEIEIGAEKERYVKIACLLPVADEQVCAAVESLPDVLDTLNSAGVTIRKLQAVIKDFVTASERMAAAMVQGDAATLHRRLKAVLLYAAAAEWTAGLVDSETDG